MTRIPFHPLLFALLPALSAFATVPGSAHPDELAAASRATVLVSGVLLLAMTCIYRDVRRAALYVSLLLLVLLTFNSIYRPIETIDLAGWHPGRRRYVLPLTYAALLACGVWLSGRRPIGPLTGFANLLALGAIVPPVVTLGMTQASRPPEAFRATNPVLHAAAVTSKPDIYYLVFDRYGDDQTARAHGLDNDLDEYLSGKGFYVARASRTNYIKTILSLASSLNLDYLDELARGREQSADYMPLYEHVARHRVGAFLRSQGYSYTHLGSWYWPTAQNPQATRNVNYYATVPRAVMRMLDSVVFAPVRQTLGEPWLDHRLQNWLRVRRQVEDVLRLVPEPGPKFVLLHVLVPHPPYVFNRDGSFATLDVESRRSYSENYRHQVLAANVMIRRLVDGILRDSARPPVIIVQGDEGPYPPGTERNTYDWRRAGTSQLRERSGIVNAYHLPGADPRLFSPRMSPVNSFRIVFNTYFGTKLPLLPDRTFRHASERWPYALDDITDRLEPVTRVARPTRDDTRDDASHRSIAAAVRR